MKTLKTTILGLALLAVCSMANAATIADHGNATKNEVIETYTNAIVHGNLSDINNAIDDNAQFYIQRGVRIQATGKRQVLDYLKANPTVEQNCKCTGTVLQEGDYYLVEKVEIKYNNVTRTDVITAQLSDDGWKITKVETSYK